jgi:phospholipid/cholesterol/gamma-HCH transport system substrate-binding protein
VRRAGRGGIGGFKAGVLALVVIGLFIYFGATKQNPFANPYELHAVFDSVNRLAERSPVRIAGVTVGKVTKVEPLEDGSGKARVTMEIEETGLPIKRDAELKVRSRLFLEGNYFVDIHPGRPDSPEIDSGSTIGPNQTDAPVQYLQVLTALQSETREDLQRLLKEYSSALRGRGARGFNLAIKHWEEAWRTTSQVNDAYLGHGPHDLTRVLDGQARVYGALSSDEEALKDLVTGLNVTMSGFAREEDNLRAAIPELRDVVREAKPALASLNSALPEIRAFARDALPGARSYPATIDAQIPFLQQARKLMSDDELGGLARRLRAAVPHLTRLNQGTRLTLEQNRALASCQNNVLLPFSKTPIPDPDFEWHTNEPWFEESPRAFVGLAGESRITDANSPMFRVLGGGGPTTIVSTPETMDGPVYGQTLVPLDGVRPVAPEKRPAFRPDLPCEVQELPDLNAQGGPADESVDSSPDGPLTLAERAERQAAYEQLDEYVARSRRGLPALDPFIWSGEGRRLQAKRLGIKP